MLPYIIHSKCVWAVTHFYIVFYLEQKEDSLHTSYSSVKNKKQSPAHSLGVGTLTLHALHPLPLEYT